MNIKDMRKFKQQLSLVARKKIDITIDIVGDEYWLFESNIKEKLAKKIVEGLGNRDNLVQKKNQIVIKSIDPIELLDYQILYIHVDGSKPTVIWDDVGGFI